MVMWIDEAKEEQLRTWVKHCPAMKLVSTLDGRILWANAAFCEWSQYTLNELRQLTWMQISVPDKNLEADVDEAKNLDAYNPTYSVKKQYVPKGAKPEWGQLTVMRYPLSGPIECCLCTWEPLKNGTAAAFTQAMENYGEITKRLEAMTTEIKTVTTQTDEDRFVLGTIRMVQRHPKIAAGFIIMALSIFGLNNVVELLQRTGLIQLPVKIEKEPTHAALANQIGTVVNSTDHKITTPAGTEIKWQSVGQRRFKSLSATDRCVGCGSCGSGQCPCSAARQGNGTDDVPDGKHAALTF